MFVLHRYELPQKTQDYLRTLTPKFGYNGFGEVVFYRTYSRIKKDGGQENWADCVIRVVNGTFSIRKDFYIKNHCPWNQEYWDEYAHDFAVSMFNMEWLPPGRGLWAMGSDFVYERGAMALYNCSACLLKEENELVEDFGWLMDCLMHGVGVGFAPLRSKMKIYKPKGTFDYIIPDTREGWVEATKFLLKAYLVPDQAKPNLIYDYIRPALLLIKGFGGLSSGPDPLILLHKQIIEQCETFKDSVIFKTNIANLIGCCVVSGNVRRSAEIACGDINDQVFLDLKDYKKYPEREMFGWMSNNSAIFNNDNDFDCLGEIAKRNTESGDPGILNKKNFPFARIGKSMKGLKYDAGLLCNPCGEIILEDKEVCNLAETLPTMCKTLDDWYEACEYAAFYCSTVSLLPTNQPTTNKVIGRNRRIGVGIIDFTGWKQEHGVHKVTRWLRNGYNIIRETNKWCNDEAGVPESVRVTTIKPGGSVPKLPGKTSGAGHPTFTYTLRRIRIQQNSPIHKILTDACIPYEKDFYSANTDVFEFPILQGPAKPASEVSLWEQSNNIVLLQREWADNAVSNTLYFKPMWILSEHYWDHDYGKNLPENIYSIEDKIERDLGLPTLNKILHNDLTEFIVTERVKYTFTYHKERCFINECKIYEYDPKHEENDIEPVLSSIVPLIKSVSLLPHSAVGVYKQMPEEGISKLEYERRLATIKPIDWSTFRGSDGMDEKYCVGDKCEIPQMTLKND